MADDDRFQELVWIACHDLRTPLATVFGFAKTLGRLDLDGPATRYVEMIEAASGQMRGLLDDLTVLVRIERGTWEPTLVEVDSLELAREAAVELGEDCVAVEGEGATVRVEPVVTSRALGQLARAAARHGGHDSVTLTARGRELELAPVGATAARVLLAEEIPELSAAASAAVVRELGGSLAADGERLLIRLPA